MQSEPGAQDRLIEWTGERCVPWTGDLQVVYEHYHRYLVAERLVEGKRVLDLASGEGYGSALMARRAASVVGLEIDPATVQHSRQTYGDRGVEFVEGSMLDLSRFEDASFDVVTCFEALEHVVEHDQLIEGVRRVLAPDGVFLTSTPDRLVYTEGHHHHENPFHVRELSLDEFRTLLDAHFEHSRIWGQAVAVGSLVRAVDEGGAPGAEVLALGRDESGGWRAEPDYPPTYFVAAASRVALPELPAQSVLVDVDLELVRSAQRQLHAWRAENDATEGQVRAELARLEAERSSLAQRLEEASATLDVRAAEGARAQAVIDGLTETLRGVRASAARAERAAEVATAREHGLVAHRDSLAAALAVRTQESAAAHHQLASVVNSRAYRLILKYYRGVEKAAPVGSRRRAAYASVGRGAARAFRSVKPLAAEGAGPVAPIGRLPMLVAPGSGDSPTVSVVIPVHGKWATTAQCLRSFVAHPPTVPYEIVVVDDASPDDTRARLAEVEGIRVVALDTNRGFIGAVNAGIEASTGEFVVMLNNDTEITEGWLEALLATAEDPGVGLVGSKLVYPDGRLQEAGGVVFADAGGWNVGRYEDPMLERYNVRRDVDYCSGAAIMVRRSVLAEIGGLDEYFAPAYYDDVDLAFTLRERGLRVVYEPAAVVVHHEGVSHGTDEASGIKAYQEVNRHKIVEKWGHRLVDHLERDAALVPRAARRLSGRGIVVVVDHHVPRPDEDAGSVRMFTLLTTLRDLGWYVIFVPDNRAHGDVWGDRLQAEGIEVFCGPEPVDHFLAPLRGSVAAVIGARVGVAWPYLSMVRRILPGVPFLFDTIDLHHLREQREAELTGDVEVLARAEATRALELGLVTASDATLVVSPFEVEVLAAELPSSTVHVVPTVHERRDDGPGPELRDGLVFVGSFAHPPNVDAVRWFLDDVFPLVRAQVPTVVLRVVGKGAPDDLVATLPDGVELLGWVPDLDDVYTTSRVAIAPLRYGAGIKGKVGEALSYGVPVVATPVAAEGMHLEHGVHALVGTSAEDFAAHVVALLRDDVLWRQLSAAGRDLIDATLGTTRFAELLEAALSAVAPTGPAAEGGLPADGA